MLKKRNLFLFGMIMCLYAACVKDPPYDQVAQAAIDKTLIEKFIKDNNIPAIQGKKGLYYQIISNGSGPGTGVIDSLDTVQVHYVGKLLNGVVFDSTLVALDTTSIKTLQKVPFYMLMPGWQIGLQLIKPGGEIRLIVPSTLAYQNQSLGTILNSNPTQYVPKNAILDFDIKLISVINQVKK